MSRLAPITNPNHPDRSGEFVYCETCGRRFHPWKNIDNQRFCTPKCSGIAHHEAAEARLRASGRSRAVEIDPVMHAKVIAECQAAWEALRKLVDGS